MSHNIHNVITTYSGTGARSNNTIKWRAYVKKSFRNFKPAVESLVSDILLHLIDCHFYNKFEQIKFDTDK